jgi:hypothetical protein
MDKKTNQYQTERKEQEQKFEALLLERLSNSKAILHTKAEFEEIRIRVRQKNKGK